MWPDIGPRIAHVLSTGEATWDEELLLFLERSCFTKETYHTFSCSPLTDDDRSVVGVQGMMTEETDRVLGKLGARVKEARTAREAGGRGADRGLGRGDLRGPGQGGPLAPATDSGARQVGAARSSGRRRRRAPGRDAARPRRARHRRLIRPRRRPELPHAQGWLENMPYAQVSASGFG